MSEMRLDIFHRHEAMDRASLALEFFSEHVQIHPAVHQNKRLRKLAVDVEDKLDEFYQEAAAEFLKHQDAKAVRAKRRKAAT